MSSKTPNIYKTILWDFDGVILDSMEIRDSGFEEVLKDFPKADIQRLLNFHRKNGGLSRYVKFRYFFEEIRNRKIDEDEVNQWAQKFSAIMLSLLNDPELIIKDSFQFIKANYKNHNFHIVSGSDGNELRKICSALELDNYFLSIEGSPTPKTKLVDDLIKKYGYDKKSICLIGDSQNDADAALKNEIEFFGYNNQDLKSDYNYIERLFD